MSENSLSLAGLSPGSICATYLQHGNPGERRRRGKELDQRLLFGVARLLRSILVLFGRPNKTVERCKDRDQIAKSAVAFSSSSTCAFLAVSHICSTVIESRLSRKVLPALRTAGSITRSSSTEFAPRSSGSAVLSDIAVRTMSPVVMSRRSRASS